MSRIEREMIAEARAARQRQEAHPMDAPLTDAERAMLGLPLADIGADVPSAPNDEQDSGMPFYSAEIIGHLLRGDDVE